MKQLWGFALMIGILGFLILSAGCTTDQEATGKKKSGSYSEKKQEGSGY